MLGAEHRASPKQQTPYPEPKSKEATTQTLNPKPTPLGNPYSIDALKEPSLDDHGFLNMLTSTLIVALSDYGIVTLIVALVTKSHDLLSTLRVQVPNSHILSKTSKLHHYYPKPKYLLIGSFEPLKEPLKEPYNEP